MKFAAFSLSLRSAIFIPGNLFGILYSILFIAATICLEPALPYGLKGGSLACTLVFFIAPALLVIAGAVSGTICLGKPHADRGLLVPYCAGFLGVFVACNLIMAISYTNQYIPYLEPGLIPRVVFVTGALIFIFPVVMLVSALFAGFSIAGGWLMYRRSGPFKEN